MEGLQLSKAARAELRALWEELLRLAVHALGDENARRDKASVPLKRVLPRHIQKARGRLNAQAGL